MASLTENLTEIKRQKDTYILPENIKKDVTVFGVTGTLESGGTATSGAKIFETQEEMQNDTNAQEGDLAIVYRNETQNATVDSKFQVATFPDTVVLDSAITDYVDVRYRAIDSSVMFDCMGSLDSSNFMMDCYTESGSIRIQYTSSDGITYTRTDNTGNPVDFGTEIYYEMSEMWNDAIGKFIKCSKITFDGLFEYKNVSDENWYNVITKYNIDTTNKVISSNSELVYLPTLEDLLIKFTETENVQHHVTLRYNNEYYIQTEVIGTRIQQDITNNKKCAGEWNSITVANKVSKVYKIDLENNTYEHVTDITTFGTYTRSGKTFYNVELYMNGDIVTLFLNGRLYNSNEVWVIENNSVYEIDVFDYSQVKRCHSSFPHYVIANTQLNATSEYVYGKEFYGKNGAESGTLQNKENLTKNEVVHRVNIWANYNKDIICPEDMSSAFGNTSLDSIPLLDTSNVTNMIRMFYYCKNLTTIPLLNTVNVNSMNNMFNGCKSLTEIPLLNTSNVNSMDSMFKGCINLITIPLIDTSNVTNMANMFYQCANLTEIPQLNTSNVTSMTYMFYQCANLTTIPLIDTSNVVNMEDMFAQCTNLTTIPELDTSSVVSMIRTFQNCTNLTSVPSLNTSNVTDMGATFASCKTITTIPLLNTSNVNSMNSMFNGCTNLTTIPQLDTSNVTDMRNMFYQCTNLTTIPQLNTIKVTGMSNMFLDCTNLEEIPQLNTSSVTDMSQMFYRCTSLTTIPQINTSNVKFINYTFYNCTSLTTIPQLNTSNVTDINGMVRGCTSLTDESLNNILAMCTSAVKITSNKTLSYIGLTQEQSTRCQSLSNYQAFVNAGWTTGY